MVFENYQFVLRETFPSKRALELPIYTNVQAGNLDGPAKLFLEMCKEVAYCYFIMAKGETKGQCSHSSIFHRMPKEIVIGHKVVETTLYARLRVKASIHCRFRRVILTLRNVLNSFSFPLRSSGVWAFFASRISAITLACMPLRPPRVTPATCLPSCSKQILDPPLWP